MFGQLQTGQNSFLTTEHEDVNIKEDYLDFKEDNDRKRQLNVHQLPKAESNNDTLKDIPRVSIMDTSSTKSIDTCLEVSLDCTTPGSLASSTAKLLPKEVSNIQEGDFCLVKKKNPQLLRSHTIGTNRRVSITNSCFSACTTLNKAKENVMVNLFCQGIGGRCCKRLQGFPFKNLSPSKFSGHFLAVAGRHS